MDLYEIIHKRRDTRHFLPEEIPEEVLRKAFQAAFSAPSVGLSEPTNYYLIKDREIKKEIHTLFVAANNKAMDRIQNDATKEQYKSLKLQGILEAPAGLIITTNYSVLKEFTIGVIGTADALQWSSVCALQNLWLSLTEQGYSLGWVSILDYNGLQKLLQLPAHEKPLGYFCIGKAADEYNNQPMLEQLGWKNRKENKVKENLWRWKENKTIIIDNQ